MRRVLVTGSNRGLGLEFVRQLLARGDRVLAACRSPAEAAELNALVAAHPGRAHVHAVEMANADSVGALASEAARVFDGLDLLVNNAGMTLRGERFGTVSGEDMGRALRTNAIGPFLLAQALAPLLAKGRTPVVANISSQLGSIARTTNFYSISYAVSKAALNMASVLLARGVAAQGICVVAFHPGWVKTDMGGAGAPLAAADSVAGLLGVIGRLKPEDSGRFLDHLGQPMPW
ncbi:MAG TPA: SDR family oxidoreductase [Xanthomonadaceae bacterium]|jgi:NAD(P)-dependent dehydrogenase (short-subunit alcohol dehydrogenase family)